MNMQNVTRDQKKQTFLIIYNFLKILMSKRWKIDFQMNFLITLSWRL